VPVLAVPLTGSTCRRALADHGRMRRFACYSGIVGPILFIATVLVEGATRSGYSAWHYFASDLALGPGGWIQVANFVVSGALVAFFAYAVPNRWGAILIGAFGVGLVLAGLFVTDPSLGYPPGTLPGKAPQTVHGTIHSVAGAIVFFSVAAAAFVLARAFPTVPGGPGTPASPASSFWRAFSPPSSWPRGRRMAA
jgi:hypothetical protein